MANTHSKQTLKGLRGVVLQQEEIFVLSHPELRSQCLTLHYHVPILHDIIFKAEKEVENNTLFYETLKTFIIMDILLQILQRCA